MVLICLGGGAAMLLFELSTFSRDVPLVHPWLWGVRVLGYGALALPGVLWHHEIMPPLLPSLFAVMVAFLNMVACSQGVVPTAKEWAWRLVGSAAKKEKVAAEEVGGKFVSFADFLRKLPRDLYIQGLQANTLPRFTLLVLYAVLNIVLYTEAVGGRITLILARSRLALRSPWATPLRPWHLALALPLSHPPPPTCAS